MLINPKRKCQGGTARRKLRPELENGDCAPLRRRIHEWQGWHQARWGASFCGQLSSICDAQQQARLSLIHISEPTRPEPI
eukprot:6162764-Pyramimonas_sp.AAC.1